MLEVAYASETKTSQMRLYQQDGHQAVIKTEWGIPGPVEFTPQWEEDVDLVALASFTNRKGQHPLLMMGVVGDDKRKWEDNVDIQLKATMFCNQLKRPVDAKRIDVTVRTAQAVLLPVKQILVQPLAQGLEVSATVALAALEDNAGVYLQVLPEGGAIYWEAGNAWFRWNWEVVWETNAIEVKANEPKMKWHPEEGVINPEMRGWLRSSAESPTSLLPLMGGFKGWRVRATNESDSCSDSDAPGWETTSYPEI